MIQGIKIRQAALNDVAQVSTLLSQTFYSQGWQSLLAPILKLGLYMDLFARVQNQADYPYACWVAEIIVPNAPTQHRMIATVELGLRSLHTQSFEGKRVAYISNLAVQQDYRHQGIGKQLLQHCEQQAQLWKKQQIYLHVRSDNLAAQSLYKKAGYAEKIKPVRLLNHQAQRVLLQKELSGSIAINSSRS